MAPYDHLQNDAADEEVPPPPPSPIHVVSSSSVTRRKSYLPKDKNPDEQRRKSKSKELRGSVNASLDSLFNDTTGACMKPSSWLVLDLDDDTSVESFLTPTQSSRSRKRLSSSSIPNSYVGMGNDSDSLISGSGRGIVAGGGGGRGTPKTRGIKSCKQRSSSFSYGSKATASTLSSSSSLASGSSSHALNDRRRQSYENHQLYDAKEVEKWASMELGLELDDYDDDEDEFEMSISSSTGKDKSASAPSAHKVDRKNMMQRQESWAVLQIDLGGTEDHTTRSPGAARNSRGRKKTRSNSISHKNRDGSSSSRSSKQRSSSRSLSKSKRRASMGALASSSGLRHSSSSSMLSSSSSHGGEKNVLAASRKLPGRTKSFEISRGPLVDRQSSNPSTSAAGGVASRKLPGRTKSFDISRLGPILGDGRQASAESAVSAGTTSKAKVRNKSFEIKRHMF